MPKSHDSYQQKEDTFLLILFALLLFASPLTFLWARDDTLWFLPYALWLLIIVIGAWRQVRYSRHDL